MSSIEIRSGINTLPVLHALAEIKNLLCYVPDKPLQLKTAVKILASVRGIRYFFIDFTIPDFRGLILLHGKGLSGRRE